MGYRNLQRASVFLRLFFSSFAGSTDRHLLQQRHRHPVLPGSHAGCDLEDRLADAAHHEDNGLGIAQCRRQHLHRTGMSLVTYPDKFPRRTIPHRTGFGPDDWFYSVVVVLVGSCPGGE